MRISLSLTVILLLFSILFIPAYAEDEGISWTDEELKFIGENPIIEIGIDPQFVPFELLMKKASIKVLQLIFLP